jgi:tetratricopeptide (TPR) repeat protein
MSHTPRVFISSARGALDAYREAARDVCFRLGLLPVQMEDFSPDRHPPAEVCGRQLETCDAIVLLLAHRYGSRPSEGGLSYTELEYEWALKHPSVPLFVFVVNPSFSWPPPEVREDPGDMARFRARVAENHVVRGFGEIATFREDLIVALRGLDSRPAHEERPARTIPAAPAFHAVPAYIGNAPFTGRTEFLTILDDWAAGADPVLVVEAIGGAGKSALTWEWARHRAPAELAGRLWWSFYEGSASITRFLREALAYVSGRPFDKVRRLDRSELAEQLLASLRERPYLLVLDGFERLLAAYHRFDPSKLRDDEVEPAKRALIEPHAFEVVRALTTAAPAKILISTRLMPDALEGRFARRLPGVRHIRLPGLTDADTLALLTKLGVHGNPRIIAGFFGRLDNHPLLVDIVVGLLRDYRPAPHDFDRWLADPTAGGALTLATLPLNQRRAHILEAAFAGLPAGHARVLGWISVLAGAVDWATLDDINPIHPDDWDAPEPNALLDAALTDLEDRGLLWWDRSSNTYDLHPVVRAYVHDQLDHDDRVYANERIHAHFEALPPEDTASATSVEDLRQTITMFRALVGAERMRDAESLWEDRLSRPLLSELGACETIVELLTPAKGRFDLRVRGDLATALRFQGRFEEAQDQELEILNVCIDRGNIDEFGIALSRVGGLFYRTGQFVFAGRYFELATELKALAPSVSDWNIRFHLAVLARESGRLDEARERLDECIRLERPDWSEGHFRCERLRIARLAGSLEWAELEGADAELHKWRDRMDIESIKFEYFAGIGDFERALSAAQESDRLQRGAGGDATPAAIAFALARLGRLDEAGMLVEQTASMVARVPFARFPHYVLAKALWVLGRRDEAARHSVEAYRQAWKDGPPNHSHWDLADATELLAELGVPAPTLPVVDPTTVVVPLEPEIRGYLAKISRNSPRRYD